VSISKLTFKDAGRGSVTC